MYSRFEYCQNEDKSAAPLVKEKDFLTPTKSNFNLTTQDILDFQKNGFLVLRGLFALEFIDQLYQLSSSEISEPRDNYGSGFSRLKYDIGNDNPLILDLILDTVFAKTVSRLVGEPVFFTQGLGFELRADSSSGFPWHVGTQSFGFQHKEDMGYTIWIPLIPINADGQRGGMAYLSKERLSGEFIYQHINLVSKYVEEQINKGLPMAYSDFSEYKNHILNSPYVSDLLNYFSTEDSFELGDAIIFDKYVLHKSIPLNSGYYDSRLAYALRFSSLRARYDQSRVEALAFPRESFNYDVGSNFNDMVCDEDGLVVYESAVFNETREQRTIR